ncbi:hypothetical protein ACWEIJ_34950 [Lentzea sp. NPDC004789]
MTVRRVEEDAPDPDGQDAHLLGERPESLVGLMGQVIGNWSTTLRVAALLALLILGLWLLPVDLTLGPLEITRH